MSLNIKNEETHRMARELARLTGESMAAAVNEAVRERLERVRRKPKKRLGGADHGDRQRLWKALERTVQIDGYR